jgi:hypothetical protein
VATSLEKITAYADQLVSAPPADATAGELLLRSTVLAAGPLLLEQLPQQPADLDDLLERFAGWLLRQRSDDALALELHYAGGDVAEQLARERELAHDADMLPPSA